MLVIEVLLLFLLLVHRVLDFDEAKSRSRIAKAQRPLRARVRANEGRNRSNLFTPQQIRFGEFQLGYKIQRFID